MRATSRYGRVARRRVHPPAGRPANASERSGFSVSTGVKRRLETEGLRTKHLSAASVRMMGAALIPKSLTRWPYFSPSVVMGSAEAASRTAIKSGTMARTRSPSSRDEVLVLKLDLEPSSDARTQTLDDNAAQGPALLGLAQQIGRLAFE